MAVKELKLAVFAHLGQDWAPCGQLVMTEEGSRVHASSFAYGLNYARRTDALEVDPVSLGMRERAGVLGKRLLPANGLPYDVLPRASHATEHFLHLGIGPQGRLATLDNALGSHEMFTLSKATACEMIANLWRVVRE